MLGKFFRLFTLLFLSLCVNSYAQPNLKFEHIMPEDGLSNNFINSIYQDSEGFMWFGTFAGLNRYDGYDFFIYESTNNPNSLSHNSIYSVKEDKKGNLWIGTEHGLNVLNKTTNTITRYMHKPGVTNQLTNDNIRSIYEDKDGTIWIGTYGGGLNKFNPKTNEFSSFMNIPGDETSIISNKVNCIFVDKDGIFWIGTELGGLSKFNKKTGKFTNLHKLYSKEAIIKDDVVLTIINDSEDNIWFGTWYEGLFKYNKSTGQFKNYQTEPLNKNSISNNTVLSLLFDKKGFLWVGTNSGGLNKFNPKTELFYRYEKDPDDANSLSHNIIWSLYQDRSGIIWIGSFGGGINKIDPDKERYELYQAKKCDLNTLSSNMITSFTEDHKGLLWIGTFGGGLNCFDRKNKTYNYFLDVPNTNKSIIRRIFEDSRKRLWVSTEECIYLFDENRLHYSEIKVFANDVLNYPTYAICEDSKGNIWLGTWNDGLKKIDAKYTNNTDFKNVPIISYKYDENNPNSLPDNVVWDILETSTGDIWLATGTGVRLFDTKNNKFINYLKDNQTNLDFGYNTSCLLEDKLGNIWFGTFGIGFYKIDKKNKTYTSFTKKTGYDVTEVLSIIEDNNNCFWLSTNKGIIKFDQTTGKIYNYGVSDGLQGSLFYKGAYCKLKSGEIAFGGINGFNIFNPDSIAISSYIPPVYITDIKLFNKSVTLEKAEEGNVLFNKPTYKIKDIELSYSQNVFSIEFAALDYSSPDKIQYAHKMEGFDKDWIYSNGKNNSATYTNLKGGDYVFRIRATNKDGIWSDIETTLNIKITPPFWRTTWFKLILSALFGYLLFLLFKYRLNILQKRFEKESLHKEREIVKLKNEKLNTDLDFKTKELAQSTMHVIRKNEDMIEIRNIINEVVPLSTNEGKSKLTKLLKHIDTKLDDSSNWEYFEYNFNLIHNNFLKRFAEQYPDINHNDLKICAYIRMNLSTKEIANLLNISYRTIESTRYRIRKKINIDTDITLNDYIMRF